MHEGGDKVVLEIRKTEMMSIYIKKKYQNKVKVKRWVYAIAECGLGSYLL